MSGPKIRPSQFITTYGTGSIIESSNGPRIILPFYQGIFKKNKVSLETYEITEPRLSQALKDSENPDVRFVSIPSNAQLGRPETWGVYGTRKFPNWSICTSKNNHKEKKYIIYKHIYGEKRTCPECPPEPTPKKAYDKAGREAIRFITACEDGHMDDIDWKWQICKSNDCSKYLYMKGSGALKNIYISCPTCKKSRDLYAIYMFKSPCKGFSQENYEHEECDKEASVIHRGATYLRFPELSMSLKIEPNREIDKFLEENQKLRALVTIAHTQNPNDCAQDYKNFVNMMPDITPFTKEKVNGFQNHDLNLSIKRLVEIQSTESNHDKIKIEEFDTLRKAAVQGVPPTSEPPTYIPNLEVRCEDVRTFEMPAKNEHNEIKLRITPVQRLKAVITQTSYRRMDPDIGKSLTCGHKDDGGRTWYPAVELIGEGLFIDLDPESASLNLKGNSINNWNMSEQTDNPPPPLDKNSINPLFVWWHTLSHRLIGSLCLNSGYGSASIRERVYISSNGKEGGVLLYTTQTGGDGTHGGLVSQANRFDKILNHAFESIDSCSNDPVCSESEPDAKILNGAACFSCLLISETSCEFRNFALDRNVLRTIYG